VDLVLSERGPRGVDPAAFMHRNGQPGLHSAPRAQRFRKYEAAVRQVPIGRLAQLASAPVGPLVKMSCTDNLNSYFAGTSALPIPQALVPDF
jgi:hypothetical protein